MIHPVAAFRRVAAMLLISFLALLSVLPAAAQAPTTVRLEFLDDSGFPGPVYNPTLGHRVLDPGLRAPWVLKPATQLHFRVASDLGANLAPVQLVFRIRTAPAACLSPLFEIGYHTETVQPGVEVTVPISAILASTVMPDPYDVHYLGITIADTNYRVDATCNDTQLGYFCDGQSDTALPLAFYYDYDGSSTAPPAVLQPMGDLTTSHYFTGGMLGQFNGKTVHGAIENYRYAVKDQMVDPEIAGRRWSLVRVTTSGGQTYLHHGGTLSEQESRLDLATPLDPNPGDHYLLYCQNLDRRGVPADSFDAANPGSSIFVCKVGADVTRDHCLRLGWFDLVGQTSRAPQCDLVTLPPGDVYAMPAIMSPGANDYYRVRAYSRNGAALTGAGFQHPIDNYDPDANPPFNAEWTDFSAAANAFPITITWQFQNEYGTTEFANAIVLQKEAAAPPPFQPVLDLDWVNRPAAIVPDSLFYVELDPLAEDSSHHPVMTLWLHKRDDPTQALALLDPNSQQCVPVSEANPVPFFMPSAVALAALSPQPVDEMVLTAKVAWYATLPSGCTDSFLTNFSQPPTGALQLVDRSSGVIYGGGESYAFEEFVLTGGIPEPTVYEPGGSINFHFEEEHQGPATVLEWRWKRTVAGSEQYWRNGAWGSSDAYLRVPGGFAGGQSDLFTQRWLWSPDSSELVPDPTSLAPFKGLGDDFFGSATQVTVTLDVKMGFGSDPGTNTLPLPDALTFTLVRSQPDVAIADFFIQLDEMATDQLHAVAGHLPEDFQLIAETETEAETTLYLGIYRADQATGIYTGLACGTLAGMADSHFAGLTSEVVDGRRRYRLTAAPGGTFYDLIDGDPGNYQVRVSSLPCSGLDLSPLHRVDFAITPAQGVAIRFHYRDLLGSSALSRLYSPIQEGSESGPTIELELASGNLTLFPHPAERTFYEPFGNPIEGQGSQPRYTDHEYDRNSGFNYMKGRYQLPEQFVFNRPDPQRDWDWLRPNTINLYEFAGNDPVNSYDPSGLGTVFVGGAGDKKNTESYANPIVGKMNEAGIPGSIHIYPTNEVGESKVLRIDWALAFSEKAGRQIVGPGGGVGVPGYQVLDPGPVIEPVVSAYDRESGQFNLVGYSFGSVVASQAAYALATDGKQVDNLVLIGAPIDPGGDLVKALGAQENIKQVTFINISEDPFSSGVHPITLFKNGMGPHFYFTSNDVGQQDQLVQILTEIFGVDLAEKVMSRFVKREPAQIEEFVNPPNEEQ